MQHKQAKFIFVLMDVDWFKEFNDHYGHRSGDETLKAVAAVIDNEFTKINGSTFRVGGEEFAGVIVTEAPEKVLNTIQNLNYKVEALQIEHKHSAHAYVTISSDVVVVGTHKEFNFDSYFKHADIALYEAKANGRNKTIIYRGFEV